MHLVVSGHGMQRKTLGTENSMSVHYLQMLPSFTFRVSLIFVSLTCIGSCKWCHTVFHCCSLWNYLLLGCSWNYLQGTVSAYVSCQVFHQSLPSNSVFALPLSLKRVLSYGTAFDYQSAVMEQTLHWTISSVVQFFSHNSLCWLIQYTDFIRNHTDGYPLVDMRRLHHLLKLFSIHRGRRSATVRLIFHEFSCTLKAAVPVVWGMRWCSG